MISDRTRSLSQIARRIDPRDLTPACGKPCRRRMLEFRTNGPAIEGCMREFDKSLCISLEPVRGYHDIIVRPDNVVAQGRLCCRVARVCEPRSRLVDMHQRSSL